jgi:hypothetical protein
MARDDRLDAMALALSMGAVVWGVDVGAERDRTVYTVAPNTARRTSIFECANELEMRRGPDGVWRFKS